MAEHDIIVMGASAGGVEALMQVVQALPAHFLASIFVVQHLPAQKPSMLPMLLRSSGPLPVFHASDKMLIEPGQIYVAPPDHHLLVEVGRVRVSEGPKEKGTRPAINPLFRSAAYAYGPRVVGVILTGALDDGTAGLLAVKQSGGVAVVQDPESIDTVRQYSPIPFTGRFRRLSARQNVPFFVVIRGVCCQDCCQKSTAEQYLEECTPQSPAI